jgi:hypothetical protein
MQWEFREIGKLHPEFVRFLLELLASPQTRCRGRILDWLGCLCRWRDAYEEHERDEVQASPVQVKTLAVLWSGLDTLLALLDDERRSVRTSAPFPVAMLFDDCREQLPQSLLTTHPAAQIVAAIEKRLNVEEHPVAKSSVVIAAGYAAKTQPQLLARLRALHLAEGNPSVRLASAMALAVCDPDIPDEAVDLLASEVQEHPGDCTMRGHFSAGDEGLEARHNPLVKAYAGLGSPIGPAAAAEDDAGAFEEVSFPWTNSDWAYLSALRALCLIKKLPRRRSVMEAFICAVSACCDYQSRDILDPILTVVFAGRPLGSEATRADLTEFQYAVLRAMYDNPMLWQGGNTFRAYGPVSLPNDRKSWRLLLDIQDRLDPAWYFERLVRSHQGLPDAVAVTEEHYRRVLIMSLYHMVDNRYIPLLARFPMLESLVIQGDLDGAVDGFAIDGEGLRQLPVLPRLTHLYVRGVDVVDIPQIERYQALMLLDLPGTHVGDRFIGRLSGLPKLAVVNLWETRITDACLQVLPSLPSLVSLDVCKTAISDDGIEMLAKLTRLQSLRIHQTNITEDGYRRLQGALPRCTIEWSRRS